METRYKELMSKALARIDELQTQLGAAQRDAGEPIAIVGLGCRFPGGGDGPRAFWEALSGGVDAAGEIHSDLAKGFIRAEVVRWNEILDAGDYAAAKKANKVRLEGKEYPVKDGDVLLIRFNV